MSPHASVGPWAQAPVWGVIAFRHLRRQHEAPPFRLYTAWQVELKGSNPSLGSHVGYVPAPESHRKDLVLPFPQGQSVVALECWENPGRGDWDHVRVNTYRGADVVCAVFSTADRASLAELERIVQVEVRQGAVLGGGSRGRVPHA